MSYAVETIELTKRFGETLAVDSLDLQVERGRIVGLIGPNGAGKTTALRMLLDIIRPTSGRSFVLGEDPARGGPQLRRRIGFIPGELRLDGRWSGATLLSFFEGVSGPVAPGAIENLAERFQLDLGKPVRALSKGNRQKVGLVQAFMHRPELLILDEPTSGLDPLMQREFLDLIRECRAAGQTILLSSHMLSEIQQTADHVWVMSRGSVVAQGAVADLRIASIRRIRASIIGPSAASVIERLESLPGVRDLRREGDHQATTIAFRFEGTMDSVVKILAAATVGHLSVEEPDLEESVLELYGNHGGEHG